MARTFLLMLLFLVPAPGVLAQTPESLPESSAYKGEIRRGPDGKLIVLKDSAAASVVEKPATMIVGSQEKITTITEAAKLAKDGMSSRSVPATTGGNRRCGVRTI